MPYVLSEIDQQNLNWFANDNTRQSLVAIELARGRMRGLAPFRLEIGYPILAIAGANGSGKSTLLAMAACAFHNAADGFRPPSRKVNYYTFSDFFVQSAGEIGPEGVEITYDFLSGYRRILSRPRRFVPAIYKQTRRKREGGKWNNYDRRVDRNVIYFGVQRVVPYYERSTHKSYRASFRPPGVAAADSARIAELAGRILGKHYDAFESLEHRRYTLPRVQSGALRYSGFNMGAGESAVFEILITLFAAGPGCLLVIDEIELGLHERAQQRLIEVLKTLCLERKCQVICTTHAYEILAALPPEGRVFIETVGEDTRVFPGISADYACGRMGRSDPRKLDILVEDEVAEAIVQASLSLAQRERVRILPIGSHSSLQRVMAARFLEGRGQCLCLPDGDRRNTADSFCSGVARQCDGVHSVAAEQAKIRDWARDHLDFLPGEHWPEKWLFEQAIAQCELAEVLGEVTPAGRWGVASEAELRELLLTSLDAGKHKEFRALSAALQLPAEQLRADMIAALRASFPAPFVQIAARVEALLI